MADICVLDTSVLLNVLNIPKDNQSKRAEIKAQFIEKIFAGCQFIIPEVVILEVGNHISQCGDGRVRRAKAKKFVANISQSFAGTTPYQVSDFDTVGQWKQWLTEFPEYAGKNKSSAKPNEGTSLADLSIIKEFEQLCQKHPQQRIYIWSLDQDLQAYDYQPSTEN